jgi:hypothetical protein
MTVLLFPGPTSTTWTVPPGVISVFAECYGEGGLASNGATGEGPNVAGGDGGGGGGYGASTLVVIPGEVYNVTAGSGGSATDSNFSGPGGTVDGSGGLFQAPPNHGTGSGDVTDDGGDGIAGAFPAGFSAGGDGGAGGGPSGGSGGTGGAGHDDAAGDAGSPGGAYGGGGGAGGGGFLGGGAGANGAIGVVILTFSSIYLLNPDPPIDTAPGITPGDIITIPSVPDTEDCLNTIVSVTFNGVPASFSIVGGNLVITVPSGITSGTLEVISSECGSMTFSYIVNSGNVVAICCNVCAVTSRCPPWMVRYGSSIRTRG